MMICLEHTSLVHNVAILIRFIFDDENDYYPQVFLKQCL